MKDYKFKLMVLLIHSLWILNGTMVGLGNKGIFKTNIIFYKYRISLFSVAIMFGITSTYRQSISQHRGKNKMLFLLTPDIYFW